MTSIARFSLKVFCPMITASPSPGSTINGLANRTGHHGVSIFRWSGHDCVMISRFWPNDATGASSTKACVNAVCIIPGCRRRASTSSFRYCRNPRTRIHEDFYLSSRGRTGNRKTSRDLLRQRLQMRFGVHRIHARIARPVRLQDRDTRVRHVAGISKQPLRRGFRRLHRN